MTAPAAIFTTPGEIGPQERSAYYTMARSQYTGRGEIVEIGALLGASTVCLAQGLQDNAQVSEKAGRLHVYDKFEVYPHLVETVFPFHGIAPRKVGDTFLDLYLANTDAYGPMLNVHQGDAHKAKWCGKPIEILFVDCALSVQLYQHFMEVFYPHLIAGALIIDQDFFYQFAPWLPVKAELMADQLKPLAAVDCTLIARCLKAAPSTEVFLPDVAAFEAQRLLERQAIRWPGEIGALVHIQAAFALWQAGLTHRALDRLKEIGDWPLNPPARARWESTMERMAK